MLHQKLPDSAHAAAGGNRVREGYIPRNISCQREPDGRGTKVTGQQQASAVMKQMLFAGYAPKIEGIRFTMGVR